MIFYITIIFWVFLDLLSKYFSSIYLIDKINIFSDLLYLEYFENRGIAFSIQVPFLKILTIILIFWIFYYYLKEEKNKKIFWIDFAFWLVLAWAIWNGYERIFNSFVVDFIWVKNFAVFNLADSFITIWAIIYLFIIFFNKK